MNEKNETERLYFEDPYLLDFEAEVIERLIHDGKPAVVLDRSCFYPEGGGQPSDRGTLNGIPVHEVVEMEGKILHVLEADFEGGRVKGRVDGVRRFDHMQQHAGQHILSQAFFELFKGETRSFHLGEEASTLEIGLSRLSEEEITKVEERANAVVFKNREIKTYFKDNETIGDVPLRRPPKVSGRIRVVEVADYDYSACGGTHPRRSGEVGMIKITRWERIRDNLRFEFLCGWRALQDYGLKHRQLRLISNELTIGESEVADSFFRIRDELKSLQRSNKKIREKLVDFEAIDLIKKSRETLLVRSFENRDPDEVRRLASAVVNSEARAVVFGLKTPGRVSLYLGCSPELGVDMRALVEIAGPIIDGKGGGPPSLVQISGTKTDMLDAALEASAAYVRSKLK